VDDTTIERERKRRVLKKKTVAEVTKGAAGPDALREKARRERKGKKGRFRRREAPSKKSYPGGRGSPSLYFGGGRKKEKSSMIGHFGTPLALKREIVVAILFWGEKGSLPLSIPSK